MNSDSDDSGVTSGNDAGVEPVSGRTGNSVWRPRAVADAASASDHEAASEDSIDAASPSALGAAAGSDVHDSASANDDDVPGIDASSGEPGDAHRPMPLERGARIRRGIGHDSAMTSGQLASRASNRATEAPSLFSTPTRADRERSGGGAAAAGSSRRLSRTSDSPTGFSPALLRLRRRRGYVPD
jgi:hypothetical protein